MDYKDRFGLVHLTPVPQPDESENSPLFTATYLGLQNRLGYEVFLDATKAICSFRSPSGLFRNYHYTLPNETLPLSHDNQEGIEDLHYLSCKPIPFRFNKRAHIRPDNFCQWIYRVVHSRAKFKDPLYWLLIPLVFPCYLTWFLFGCYSMTRHFKTRNGYKFRVTDGKLILLSNCLAGNWRVTLWVFTRILDWNSEFDGWADVALTYYRDENHPVVKMTRAIYGN